MSSENLTRLAQRAVDPQYDPRHAILDITPELRALRQESLAWPPHLQIEFADLLGEIEAVQPAFPSHRNTSPLFDRAGMGQHGRDHAGRLVRRLVSLARSLGRESN